MVGDVIWIPLIIVAAAEIVVIFLLRSHLDTHPALTHLGTQAPAQAAPSPPAPPDPLSYLPDLLRALQAPQEAIVTQLTNLTLAALNRPAPTPAPPLMPDLPALVREMGEAFAKTVVGFQPPVYPNTNGNGGASVNYSMADLGLANEPVGGTFIPDIEADPTMPGAPTKGGWVDDETFASLAKQVNS